VNKKLLGLIFSAVLIIIIFLCAQFSSRSFNNLLGTKETNITKVFMRNGSNGNWVETNDKDKIKELFNLLNNRYYRIALNQVPRVGYSYYYDFYSGDKKLLRMTGNGNNVQINNTYYNVSEEVSHDLLKSWFNSLPVTMEGPPGIAITIGGWRIDYIAEKNRWNSIDYDREDTFKTILNKSNVTQIPYIKIGDTASICFTDNPPDKFTISDNLIDNKGIRRYNDAGTINIPIELKDGKGFFEIKKHMASGFDSYRVEGKSDLRGFRMTASWGENECEYAFIIRADSF